MTNLLPSVPPEVMTGRARTYLMLTALYCLSLGLFCLLFPWMFNSVSFGVVESAMPGGFVGWGIVHLSLGLIASAAAWRGSEALAIGTLIGAAMVVGAWDAGFYNAWFALPWHKRGAPSAMIAYTFITGIHLVQARLPLRSPFEPIIRMLDGDE